MGQLIDDLLRFSRLGHQPLAKRNLDMVGLVNDVVAELRAAEPDRRLTIRVSRLPDASADPSLMRQVVVNLLANALKFTRNSKEALVEVDGRREGGQCVYSVSDNGAGFDMRYADKLFGIFQRLHASDEFEGTGVGLSVVRRIVERHSGRVSAEAAVGRGAKFTFTLPSAE